MQKLDKYNKMKKRKKRTEEGKNSTKKIITLLDESISGLEMAKKKLPDDKKNEINKELLFRLGYVYYHRGNFMKKPNSLVLYNKALKYFAEYEKSDPDNINYLNLISSVYRKKGNKRLAKKYSKKYKKLANKPVNKAWRKRNVNELLGKKTRYSTKNPKAHGNKKRSKRTTGHISK